MGVTVLHTYQTPDNKTGAQVMEQLQKSLIALGASHTGNFLVDCETYFTDPRTGPSKAVHVMHNSEFPATTFSILENGTSQIPIVADNVFDLLMLKMTPLFSTKKPTKVESKGARFEYGDFLIKIGSVTLMENCKGLLIEIEYQPCVVICFCWGMIREIFRNFLGINMPSEYPSYFLTPPVHIPMNQQQQTHTKVNENYEPIDTMLQYLEHFGNFRKQGSVPQTGIHLNPTMHS